MTIEQSQPERQRWAQLCFGIIAQLLSASTEPGEFGANIVPLAAPSWRHPTTGETWCFRAILAGLKTFA